MTVPQYGVMSENAFRRNGTMFDFGPIEVPKSKRNGHSRSLQYISTSTTFLL